MGDPNKNFVAVIAAKTRVKNHPMCAKFEETGGAFMVTYPAGDFPVDGVRVHYMSMGKRKALEILLDKMERHWVESFPASR